MEPTAHGFLHHCSTNYAPAKGTNNFCVAKPVTSFLGFILLELSGAFNKWINPCSFKGFLPLASGTLHPPRLPHNSLGAPHPCLVLLAPHLPNVYSVEHLRTQLLVLFSPLSTLTPSVISSWSCGFKYHPHADDSQIYVSGQPCSRTLDLASNCPLNIFIF